MYPNCCNWYLLLAFLAKGRIGRNMFNVTTSSWDVICHGLVSVALARNWDTCGRNIEIPVFSTPQPGCQSPPGFSCICGLVRESQPKPLFATVTGWEVDLRNPCIFWHSLRSYSPCLTKCDDATSHHTSCFSRTITKQLRRLKLIQMRALGQHILPANLGMRRAILGRWKQPTKPWSVPSWLRVFFCDSLVLMGTSGRSNLYL